MNHAINFRVITVVMSAIVALAGCDKEDVRSGQLLTNTDVEAGSTMPSGWWSHNGLGKYSVKWTDTESFSPSKSLEISTQTGQTSDFAFWGQTINANIPAGKGVTLSVKVKGNLTGSGVSIVIRGDNTTQPEGSAEQFVTTQGTKSITGTFEWTDYSIKLDNVESAMQSLTVYLVYLSNTTGEAYFDDIELSF